MNIFEYHREMFSYQVYILIVPYYPTLVTTGSRVLFCSAAPCGSVCLPKWSISVQVKTEVFLNGPFIAALRALICKTKRVTLGMVPKKWHP